LSTNSATLFLFLPLLRFPSFLFSRVRHDMNGIPAPMRKTPMRQLTNWLPTCITASKTDTIPSHRYLLTTTHPSILHSPLDRGLVSLSGSGTGFASSLVIRIKTPYIFTTNSSYDLCPILCHLQEKKPNILLMFHPYFLSTADLTMLCRNSPTITNTLILDFIAHLEIYISSE
jgi:hypothetical protein